CGSERSGRDTKTASGCTNGAGGRPDCRLSIPGYRLWVFNPLKFPTVIGRKVIVQQACADTALVCRTRACRLAVRGRGREQEDASMRMNSRCRAVVGLALILLVAWSGQAFADPPSRVARLSYVRGDVSFQPAGESSWLEAQINRPLITGDQLYTD